MKKIVTIILSSFALVSCVDTVLLPDNKTVEEDFWQTKSDVAMMVNGAYAKMANSNVQQRLVVWTSRSDELNVNSQINNSELNQINSANIQTTNSYNSWNDLYAVINACNLVISKSADVMDIDPNYLEGDHLNNVGQMKALRALCYFYLVRVYRDVPLILEPYKNSSQDMLVPQVAPSIVMNQIIADLEEVKDQLLSTQSINDWTRCGYITRDGAYAMLADAYLWKASVMGDANSYDKCIDCCEAIRLNRKNDVANQPSFGLTDALDDDGFGLNPYYNYFKVFAQTGNDRESLFEMQFTDNPGLCIVYNRYKNNSSQPQFYVSSVYAKVSADANHVFNNAAYSKDVRGCESVYTFNLAADEGFLVRKYVASEKFSMMSMTETDLAQGESSPIPAYSPFDANWIFYRVTDVMLMKAEALVQKALLYANANTDLVENLAAATTQEDSLALANELYEINQTVSKWNVAAARLAQIVNTRARIDATSSIDSTKYIVSSSEYTEGDLAAFVSTQVATFNGFVSTASTLETMIMDERARELCFEGKRWFDMLRYNYRHVTGVNYNVTLAQQGGTFVQNYSEMLKLIARKYTSGGGTGVTSKMPTEPYLYMPVLESEIDVNPLLVQNPVYQSDGTYEKNY